MKRPLYVVLVSDPETSEVTEHTVDLRHVDRLRGELEANKAGLPPVSNSTGQTHTTIYVWAALVREGAYAGSWQNFRGRDLVEMEPVRDEAGQPAFIEVGPTRPGPSTGPDSPSAITSPASTGSDQTSTNA